jgi:hypothetical protein
VTGTPFVVEVIRHRVDRAPWRLSLRKIPVGQEDRVLCTNWKLEAMGIQHQGIGMARNAEQAMEVAKMMKVEFRPSLVQAAWRRLEKKPRLRYAVADPRGA